jgi:hypothetical protein
MNTGSPPAAPLHYARMLIRSQRRFATWPLGTAWAATNAPGQQVYRDIGSASAVKSLPAALTVSRAIAAERMPMP